jgi:hypothetical protein
MSSAQPDVFESFAAQCQLQLRAEPLVSAPRDVLADIEETEQHYLVTLTSRVSEASVRSVFIKPTIDPSLPDFRDVLWWLASDAWAVRQSGRELERWARVYRYSPDAEPTARVFERHLAQSEALERLLGQIAYDRLLSLYDAEVGRAGKA